MSLESKIDALTAAVIALTAKIESNTVPASVPVVQAPVAAPAPVATPAPPAFASAPVVAAPAVCPITDGKSLIDYVMGAYRAMGPQKGAQIQSVLVGLGYQNINDVKPEHYAQLFAQVEALK